MDGYLLLPVPVPVPVLVPGSKCTDLERMRCVHGHGQGEGGRDMAFLLFLTRYDVRPRGILFVIPLPCPSDLPPPLGRRSIVMESRYGIKVQDNEDEDDGLFCKSNLLTEKSGSL